MTKALPLILLLFLSVNSLPVEVSLLSNTNSTCQTCISLVTVIEKLDKLPNETIYDIVYFIESICSKIISPMGKECLAIAHDINHILDYISHGIQPNKICSLLHFCNKTC
jgi:hypothetical protein